MPPSSSRSLVSARAPLVVCTDAPVVALQQCERARDSDSAAPVSTSGSFQHHHVLATSKSQGRPRPTPATPSAHPIPVRRHFPTMRSRLLQAAPAPSTIRRMTKVPCRCRASVISIASVPRSPHGTFIDAVVRMCSASDCVGHTYVGRTRGRMHGIKIGTTGVLGPLKFEYPMHRQRTSSRHPSSPFARLFQDPSIIFDPADNLLCWRQYQQRDRALGGHRHPRSTFSAGVVGRCGKKPAGRESAGLGAPPPTPYRSSFPLPSRTTLRPSCVRSAVPRASRQRRWPPWLLSIRHRSDRTAFKTFLRTTSSPTARLCAWLTRRTLDAGGRVSHQTSAEEPNTPAADAGNKCI
ncbi:hypothetical protein FA95DRAFT_1674661 [Auriscalpium vulgare]|uniref:Uncharacterized protein n=1 Tax=Auriscalpium vulgare TaxID=40419 RepID=A0ACB8S8W6_9AGAM|nr:hypothetical protein FA95DRAFT_1674661 [Auriscalpium vulgare]